MFGLTSAGFAWLPRLGCPSGHGIGGWICGFAMRLFGAALGIFELRIRCVIPFDRLGCAGFWRFGGRGTGLRGRALGRLGPRLVLRDMAWFAVFGWPRFGTGRRAVQLWRCGKARKFCAVLKRHIRADGREEALERAFAQLDQGGVLLNSDGADVIAGDVAHLAQYRQDAAWLGAGVAPTGQGEPDAWPKGRARLYGLIGV